MKKIILLLVALLSAGLCFAQTTSTSVLKFSIYFDTDKAKLTSNDQINLMILSFMLKTNPGKYKVKISGHTDSTGTVAHNIPLSKDRAEVVGANRYRRMISAVSSFINR